MAALKLLAQQGFFNPTVTVDCHCGGMGEMTPDKGVFKRKGSGVWQHRVFIPKDLQPLYGGKAAFPAKSLQTCDLAEANRRARRRHAEFEREFDTKRGALKTIASKDF